MIRYALVCRQGHDFDGWFRNSEAFDRQLAAGQLTCAICGSAEVEKAVMAPSVPGKAQKAGPPKPPAGPGALAQLRKKIEESSDYVGRDFAREARAIHEGESKARPIWGEASPNEAKSLKEDGVPVTPIPWMVRRND